MKKYTFIFVIFLGINTLSFLIYYSSKSQSLYEFSYEQKYIKGCPYMIETTWKDKHLFNRAISKMDCNCTSKLENIPSRQIKVK